MKITRSISIEVEVWEEAKKLPNISKVINDLLKDYLEISDENYKQKELKNMISFKKEEQKTIKNDLFLLEKKLEEIRNEARKQNEAKKIILLKEEEEEETLEELKKIPLTINEILFFQERKDINYINYNKSFFTEYNEKEFNIRKNLFETKLRK